jgi:transposase-like protein
VARPPEQGTGEPKLSVRVVSARLRAIEAVKLRVEGNTYTEIARRVGYANRSTAFHAVNRELERTAQEPADQLRTLECERLNELLRALWPKAMAGNTQAVEKILMVMDRRARYLGLDAPVRIDVTEQIRILVETAVATGLDEAEAVAIADRIVRQHARSGS